jgi:hypothetical protein
VKQLLLLVVLTLLPLFAVAESPAAVRVIAGSEITYKPSLMSVVEALDGSRLSEVSTSITVSYDQSGKILAAKLDNPTGDWHVDRAIISWARKLKLETKEAGVGSIPFKIQQNG